MEEASQKVEANKEMDNLVRMLRTDTAAESDQFGQIMEQPVSVTPFFQKGEQEIALPTRVLEVCSKGPQRPHKS